MAINNFVLFISPFLQMRDLPDEGGGYFVVSCPYILRCFAQRTTRAWYVPRMLSSGEYT